MLLSSVRRLKWKTHGTACSSPIGDCDSMNRTPQDQPTRERIERELDRTFLVEAGAGSGKTHSLVRRIASGVARGVYQIEHVAAVTFTRKSAAELRGRLQLALEDRLKGQPSSDERARIEAALSTM